MSIKLKESQLIPIIETISTKHSNYLATIAKENGLPLENLIVNIEVELKVIDTDSVEIIENNDN